MKGLGKLLAVLALLAAGVWVGRWSVRSAESAGAPAPAAPSAP